MEVKYVNQIQNKLLALALFKKKIRINKNTKKVPSFQLLNSADCWFS